MIGKTIFAIAAGHGIGRPSGVACMTLGARVIATDINSEALSELSKAHPEICTLQLDVCDRQGIHCNALCPGTVDTPSLWERIASAADPEQAEKESIAHQPMGRLATVDDLTPMITYLLSDASKFITAQACSVDGGVTI